ncbi:MAG: cbb3-type cytochrome c oxidase subunit I [Caldilineaceae bacterium]
MSLMDLGLVRGLTGQVIGTVFGMALAMTLRVLFGYDAWGDQGEGVITTGAFVGGLSFLIGVGGFTDWAKWWVGIPTPFVHGPPKNKPAWTRYFGVDYNHKVIGVQYGVTGLLMIMIGGVFALIFRTELSRAGLQFLDENTYNTLLSLHGWATIFGMLIGIGGMANYIVPLMLGAEDMAFPRLNAFAFWLNVPGALLLLSSIFSNWDSGWTLYPPLSLRGPVGYQLAIWAIVFLGFSSILGSLNLIATIFLMRPPGMTLFRMPIFCWAILATSAIQLTATQAIGQAVLMLSFERLLGMPFFDANHGGNPVLFQHVFWFYSHPAVYVFVLPGLGVISEILPVFSRKPLFGYRWIALSSIGIALVGFIVWGHHMFTSAYSPYLRVWFMLSTLLVAVPTGVKFFSWLGTLWGGKLTFPTPMLFALGAITVFLIGGLSGPILGTVPSNLQLHNTYFVVGHFHATIFGGFTFPFFAAIYFWYPKITGRMYNEALGKLHFWVMTPAFWVMSLTQMSIGIVGMRRRIADYDQLLGGWFNQQWNLGWIEVGHILITIAGFAIAFSILVAVYNFFQSAEVGRLAGANPWRSRSPEWQIPSPVPEQSFASPIRVVGEPYDYGLAGSRYVAMGAGGDD